MASLDQIKHEERYYRGGLAVCVLTDVPKAQGDQKVIIMLIHVRDGCQITVNQNETIVLLQGSGSLKHTDYIACINNYF